jgi:hypothetical protein
VFEAVQNRTVPHLLINRVIYHSILLSISNITDPSNMVPIYHPDTGTLETKLLYEYDSFWRKLLKSNSLKDEESAVQKVVFDAFMKNILVILKRLDLSYRYDIHTERSNKYESGYKPNVPRDHSIMLNLTELFQRVLTPINSERILPWVSNNK